jgi:aspartyl-tRNA(Asn)/glutamyl-tRNA(Gln) amidotransferase subunit B
MEGKAKPMKYTPIIGLEVHVELKTESKMFCSCSANYFGEKPNTHTCPVCLGLPGALPVPNKTAIEWCKKIALALNCKVATFSKFDRKNYFYPDLAKSFQLSQYDLPFGEHGSMTLTNGKTVRIRRVHMEEDTGKLTHIAQDEGQSAKGSSLIDFNRSGVPLVEIVTEHDFQDEKEVKEYLQNLQQIVRYLDVSNADMEKGDMRLEPNISLIPSEKYVFPLPESDLPKYKVEVKNINSFRFVERAIQFEIKRHTEMLDRGETPTQETRGWNETKQATVSQRSKEDAKDYRYFPEPDIPPILTTEAAIQELKDSLPELPQAKIKRFIDEFSLSYYDAEILTRDKVLAKKFEDAVKIGHEQAPSASSGQGVTAKQIANAIINKKVDPTNQSAQEMVEIIKKSSEVVTLDDTELEKILQEVISEQPKAVEDFKNGKETVIMFLVGCVMKKLSVKPDVSIIKEKLQSALQ